MVTASWRMSSSFIGIFPEIQGNLAGMPFLAARGRAASMRGPHDRIALHLAGTIAPDSETACRP